MNKYVIETILWDSNFIHGYAKSLYVFKTLLQAKYSNLFLFASFSMKYVPVINTSNLTANIPQFDATILFKLYANQNHSHKNNLKR